MPKFSHLLDHLAMNCRFTLFCVFIILFKEAAAVREEEATAEVVERQRRTLEAKEEECRELGIALWSSMEERAHERQRADWIVGFTSLFSIYFIVFMFDLSST